MEVPLGCPNIFRAFVDQAKDGAALYRTILKQPVEEIVQFFDCAVDDSTWYEERGGGPFMKEMVPYLNEMVLNRSMSQELMVEVAKGVRRNVKTIFPFLPEDVTFNVQGEKFSANSMLFRIFGEEYFSNLIDSYVIYRKVKEIPIEGISKKGFKYVKEFIYTQEMVNLWKEEPKFILDLQKKSNAWNLKELSNECFQVFRNYISQDVLFKRLFASFEDKNFLLTQELLEVVKKENTDFELTLSPQNWFDLKLRRLNYQTEELLSLFLNYVTLIVCETDFIDEEILIRLLKKSTRLEKLDLSGLSSVRNPIDLMDSIPDHLRNLKLKDQQWVQNHIIDKILTLKYLRVLDLSNCVNFQLRLLTDLSQMTELEALVLSGNEHVNVQEMKILCPAIKQIRSLNIARCPQVNQEVIQLIINNLKDLSSLNLSSCQQLTEESILLLLQVPTLRRLNIKNIKAIPPNFKERYRTRFWHLTQFDL